MTVKDFLIKYWRSLSSYFIIVKDGVQTRLSILELSICDERKKVLTYIVDYIDFSDSNDLLIYCC